jgi:uncharacterized protein
VRALRRLHRESPSSPFVFVSERSSPFTTAGFARMIERAAAAATPSNNAAAASWYRKAAEQGDARAQNNLGIMYDKGYGVRQDPVSAHMWLNIEGETAG